MKIETQCLHEGYHPKNGEPSALPIVQSTTYRFDSTAHIAGLFDMPTEFMYSRFANPTCDDEQLIAAGIEPGLVRLSVGLENVQDIISDLDQALAQL